MELGWARDIRDDCRRAGIPFFFKQHAGIRPKALGIELDGRTHQAWPERPVNARVEPPAGKERRAARATAVCRWAQVPEPASPAQQVLQLESKP